MIPPTSGGPGGASPWRGSGGGAPGVSLHTFALNLFILHIEIEHALMYNTDDSNTNPRR